MMLFLHFSALFSIFAGVAHASRLVKSQNDRPWQLRQGGSSDQAVFKAESQAPFSGASRDDDTAQADAKIQKPTRRHSAFSALLEAVEVMQSHYFEVWVGTWPKAIDWTAAVMGTHISSTLSSMSDFKADHFSNRAWDETWDRVEALQEHENLINQYFTQITTFYFGENAFGLRLQAFDDMLWVVLDWLEAIKFIDLHSRMNYGYRKRGSEVSGNLKASTWYGQQFVPQFAHRARLFYDLASEGWNTSLCGGGMIWNPYLTPYKNAITNQLFIAASVGMYLHFPGDNNSSPFMDIQGMDIQGMEIRDIPPAWAHDPKYLNAAIEAYDWLKKSNMTNEKGLYVDGFHIQGWRGGHNSSRGTGECDVRDEQVYTYNQGVLLSGLRGLWDATGGRGYLDDGHKLIQNVIAATGWHQRNTKNRWKWAGIGRNGILEESCDSSGTCSQNGHTFKGIFFHHLTIFCAPLSRSTLNRDGNVKMVNEESLAHHERNCHHYGSWIRHNAHAAQVTRDPGGKFGTWWGRRYGHHDDDDCIKQDDQVSNEGTDYRNRGVPKNALWRLPNNDPILKKALHLHHLNNAGTNNAGANYLDTRGGGVVVAVEEDRDVNDRGRGRTVETQSGGLAVLRAWWQIVERRKGVASSSSSSADGEL